MAISFVGSSNVSNGLAQGTSAVVPKPGGVVDGDFLLAFVSIGNTAAITAPAGWTEVPMTVNTAPNLQNRIYRKVASGEPASWTWTFTSAAYVGICHATRGVSHVFAAAQDDDGLSLLSHTTPVVAAPANAWLVSSWTGRNLLALGWAPPVGDVERQDVIGGLLILLNVNHAVDDTNGAVAAGSYSKTAATLVSVRALNALIALAPTLDPIIGVPIDLKALLDLPVMGPGLVGTPVETFGHLVAGTLTPGEVFIDGSPIQLFAQVPDESVVTPGEAFIVGMPLTTHDQVGTGVLAPGEVVIIGSPVQGFQHVGSPIGEIMLGYLLSQISPVDGMLQAANFLTGQQIGSNITPFIIPPINTVNAYEGFGPGQVIFQVFEPACCTVA